MPSFRGLLERLRNIASPPTDAEDGTADPRAEADRLVASGHLVDAIRVLTEANRVRRDPAIEQRLVELRFEAFARATPPPATPPWPDTVEDLFPGELVPVIDRADLTVENLRSALFNHGSLHVRGLLDPPQVEQLHAGVDRSMEAYDAHLSGTTDPELDGWFVETPECPEADRSWKRKAGAVLAVDSPPALFDLIEIFDQTGISKLAADHFGEDPTLLGLKTTLRKVPARSWRPGDWHQDGSFMGTDIRSLNVWLALTHCGDDAPGLDVVGRRIDHLAQSGTDGAGATWSVGVAVAEQEGAGAIVRPIFEPGDALLFDHLLLHRTAIEAEMQHDRYAVETWLFAPSTYGIMTSTDEQPNPPHDQRPFWL